MKKRSKNPATGARIVHNKLLGGWYVVRGTHQTPLSGRFNSKAEAQAYLRRKKNPEKIATINAPAKKGDGALVEVVRSYTMVNGVTERETVYEFVIVNGVNRSGFIASTENMRTGSVTRGRPMKSLILPATRVDIRALRAQLRKDNLNEFDNVNAAREYARKFVK